MSNSLRKDHRLSSLRESPEAGDQRGSISKDSSTVLLTTPLFYVNGELHVGHAYTLVAADVIKRYNLITGKSVVLLSGTDEHGTKIHCAAEAAGKSTQEHVDSMRKHFIDVTRAYNVSVDINVQTASEDHSTKVKQVFHYLIETGDIYEGIHECYFSPKEDCYYTEFQLVDGKSPSGFEVQRVAEKAFFFRLSKYRDRLLKLLSQEGFVKPEERRNEAIELLRGEVPDVAVTRSNTTWGVPVDIKGFEGQTVYVWLDALLGYIVSNSSGCPVNSMIMVFGKDILRFITLMWPALLMALGRPTPEQLVCHGWLLHKEQKISKSKGDKVPALPPLGNADISRFVLMSLGAFGNDFNYCTKSAGNLVDFVRDKYANLVHRVTALLQQRGLFHLRQEKYHPISPFVSGLVNRLTSIDEAMKGYRIDKYVQVLNEMTMEINNYITLNQIWNVQDDGEFNEHALAVCQALLTLSVYVYPFMPCMAQHILERVGPRVDRTTIEPGSSVDVLKALDRVEFNPRHMAPLM